MEGLVGLVILLALIVCGLSAASLIARHWGRSWVRSVTIVGALGLAVYVAWANQALTGWTEIFLALSGVLAGVGVSAVTLAPAMKASDRGEHRREHRFVGVGFGIVVLLVVAWTKGVSRLLAAIAIDGGGGMYGVAF